MRIPSGQIQNGGGQRSGVDGGGEEILEQRQALAAAYCVGGPQREAGRLAPVIDPGDIGADDERARRAQRELLPGMFGTRIFVQQRHRRLFIVQVLPVAVEEMIGGNLDEGPPGRLRPVRQRLRGRGVDRLSHFRLGLA